MAAEFKRVLRNYHAALEQHANELEERYYSLKRPQINGFCGTEAEHVQAMREEEQVKSKGRQELTQAKDTHLKDRDISTHHWDEIPTAVGRLFVYRYGELDNRDIDKALGKLVNAAMYEKNKARIADIETIASRKARRAILYAVVQTFSRAGGLEVWKKAPAESRMKIWEDMYDELPYWISTQVFHEEGFSVSFDLIYGQEDNLLCRKFQAYNKYKVLQLMKATWDWIIDPQFEIVGWAVKQVWRIVAQDDAVGALELPDGIGEIPSVPGGHYGSQKPLNGVHHGIKATDAYTDKMRLKLA